MLQLVQQLQGFIILAALREALVECRIRMLRLYVGATHGAQPGLAIEREGLFVLAYIRRFYFILHLAYTLT